MADTLQHQRTEKAVGQPVPAARVVLQPDARLVRCSVRALHSSNERSARSATVPQPSHESITISGRAKENLQLPVSQCMHVWPKGHDHRVSTATNAYIRVFDVRCVMKLLPYSGRSSSDRSSAGLVSIQASFSRALPCAKRRITVSSCNEWMCMRPTGSARPCRAALQHKSIPLQVTRKFLKSSGRARHSL